jgi:dTDP-glucose 4,6-dehydratase
VTWSGRHVLVTGAGGFIGSHLAESLVALGARTRAMVHYNAFGTWGWLDSTPRAADMEVVAGDVRDRDSVRRAMQGVDCVFNLAALIGIPYSYEAPESYVHTNVTGLMNVLQAARELGTQRVVHISTSEVYGTAQYAPIDERHPLQGQSPYSASKIAADKMAEAFHHSFGVPVVIVRPFNTYGPRQSARAVIPTIITQCLADTVVRLGNVSPTRDFTFVSDTVAGILAAAQAGGVLGRTLNLGTGSEIGIGELARRIAAMLGSRAAVSPDESRMRPKTSEVERLVSDNRLMRELTGWQPSVGLDEGLKRTADWIRANLGRYRPALYSR